MPPVRARRFSRRLTVRFWKPEETRPQSGYTTNISMSGMFIATRDPLPPGARVRIELTESDELLALHGEVMHAARVAPSMLKVRPAGMGVRLLSLREMMASLIGRDVGDEVETLGEKPVAPQSAGSAGKTVFPILLQGSAHFLEVYERELRYGELFIPTQEPQPLHELVTVTIDPPLANSPPIELEARVVQSVSGLVHRLDPSREAGMVVVFSDPRRAENRFREIRRSLMRESGPP